MGVTPVIAIDGPAGAGKSTVARRLAAELGWAWLDTGAMYRALTLAALEEGIPRGDGVALAALAGRMAIVLEPGGRVLLGGRDVTREIRSEAVTAAVSQVAGLPEVRRVMVEHQRRFASGGRRVVAEGRDIGTVVFPEAAVKIYLDAEPRERARRRLRELREEGAGEAGVEGVLAGIERRDRQDAGRAVAPLRPHPEAWLLDTTPLTLEQVFERVLGHVRSSLRPRPTP